ncbi:MAG: lantibiotic dehydratase family protein [Bacteroidota bacterium]
MRFPYKAFDQFVLRTPLLSIEFFRQLTSATEVSDERLKKAYGNAVIKEAIFLASPTLYFELEKWMSGDLDSKKEQRVKQSLLKYLSRMSSRCTPFGLFAGCTLGSFAEQTDLEIGSTKDHQRFTRPDMNYLVALSQDLAKREHIKNQLTYFPNSSLYRVGEQLRYIEYFYVENRRQHHIVEIDHSPYLQKVLECAAHGASLQRMSEAIVDDEISLSEASSFLEELLDSQVLTSNLEPSVSGPPFIHQMLKVLQPLKGCEKELKFLNGISQRFTAIDHTLGNNPQQYLELSAFLKEQTTTFELKYLFQTDLEPHGRNCTLANELLSSLKTALALFNSLTPKPSESNLSSFKEAFVERYEEREMPLSQVLDVETGIGYLQNIGSGDINPLVDDLFLPPSENVFDERELKWNAIQLFLLKKLLKAREAKAHTIHLKTSDFEGFSMPWDDLPDTLSFMIELVRENGQTKIQISGGGGSSAANLLGRFCHQESSVTPYTKKIVGQEMAMTHDKLMAEIVHLPEARVGNILMRPNLREFEIPYLAQSVINNDKKLPLDDLHISVRRNRIYLRSKSHGKEVVPRLTNAHNYSANALPIYHFLSDLQTQDLRSSIGFNFGPLEGMFDFLPRVEYQNLILHEARWRIKKEDFKDLVGVRHQKQALMNAIQRLQKNSGIPPYVLLVDGDNELLINLKNYSSVLMLLETIKNREDFVLKEFLHHQDGLVRSENGYHTNQVVVSFFNESKINRVFETKKEVYDTA